MLHVLTEKYPTIAQMYRSLFSSRSQIPVPDVAIHSLHIDGDGAYLAAVNSKVSQYW